MPVLLYHAKTLAQRLSTPFSHRVISSFLYILYIPKKKERNPSIMIREEVVQTSHYTWFHGFMVSPRREGRGVVLSILLGKSHFNQFTIIIFKKRIQGKTLPTPPFPFPDPARTWMSLLLQHVARTASIEAASLQYAFGCAAAFDQPPVAASSAK